MEKGLKNFHQRFFMDYIETDNVLADIDKLIGLQEWLRYITATKESIDEARDNVLSDSTFNPVLDYPELREDTEKGILGKLYRFGTDGSALGGVFRRKYEELSLLFESVKCRGNPREYSEFSDLLFGRPSAGLVEEAYSGIDAEIVDEIEDVPQEDVRRSLQEHMDCLGIGFNVVIDPEVNAARPDYNSNLLRIPDRPRSGEAVERLKVHEIGHVDENGRIFPGHIMRAYLGSQQPYKIFKTGTGFYLKTEEGLGVLAEKRAGVLSKRDEKKFRGRVIASHLALEGSFADVYNELLKLGFPKEDAFREAYRSKRGLKDTKESGGTTKDYFYFDTRDLEGLSPKDRELLSVGKIDVIDIPDVKILLDNKVLILPELKKS
jgi:hypothetical protein